MTTQPQRTAIVTGAARGIGAAIAKRLASERYAIAVLDLDETACKPTVEEIEAAGGSALAVGIDVSDEDQVSSGVARVAEALGSVTVLVNNAGITRDSLLFKLSVDDWDLVLDVHLRGSFLMTRAGQGFMTERSGAGSSTCRAPPRWETEGRRTTRPRKPACKGSPKSWRSSSVGRRDRQRHRAGVHWNRYDRCHSRWHRSSVRGVQSEGRRDHPGGSGRHSRRHRHRGLILRSRGKRLRVGVGAVCRRRPRQLTEGSQHEDVPRHRRAQERRR